MRRDVARASGWKKWQGWRLHVQGGWNTWSVCGGGLMLYVQMDEKQELVVDEVDVTGTSGWKWGFLCTMMDVARTCGWKTWMLFSREPEGSRRKGVKRKARREDPKKQSEAEKAQSECMSALRSEEEDCGRRNGCTTGDGGGGGIISRRRRRRRRCRRRCCCCSSGIDINGRQRGVKCGGDETDLHNSGAGQRSRTAVPLSFIPGLSPHPQPTAPSEWGWSQGK